MLQLAFGSGQLPQALAEVSQTMLEVAREVDVLTRLQLKGRIGRCI
jgi:hypothetical protein